MSGLVSFFKDFFPNVQNIDYNRRLEDLTADEKGVAVPPAAKKADTNQSAQPQVQPQVQQQHEQLIQALSKPPPRSNVQFTPDLVTFREWRQYSKESLKAFYLRRFVTEEDDQEDNGGSSGDQEEEEDKDEADVWESDVEIQDEDDENDETAETIEPRQQQGKGADDGGNELALESQPPPQAPNDEQEQANTSPRNIKKSAKRRIPPLYQAIHSIQTLEYLDLRTKDLSLDLCSVNKVWRLRETRRGLAYLHSATKGEYQTRCCVFPGRMPRVLFGHLQDDGPMSSIYDYVLSLEVQQLLPTPRRVSPHGGVPRKAVVRIFLYNAYAKAVSEWMDEQSIRRGEDSSKRAGDAGASSNKNGFILSLSKIPALSIFPYALDPRDWWDQEHVVHHCVCLGDSSAMMATRHMDGTTEQVRADSDDMELRLAVAGAGVEASAASELVVSKSMLSGPPEEAGDDDDYLLEPNPLVETWKQYLESKKPPASTQAPAVTTATAKVTTQHNTAILGPPAPIAPVMPNFSTAVSSAQTNEPIPAAPPVEPGILVPPNRPPPPSPVHRPVETMTFEGSARKRPRINDVTNLPNRTAAAATTYSSLASLKSLYDSNRREDGRGVINPNLTVNTYGVVMGFTAPNQTKRGDWMVECNLVDETCTVPVTAVIFTKSNLELPKFQRMGDVLRLHRVHLQIWKGDVQLTGKRHTSFVVIRKTAGTALTDVATRTATSQVTEETKTNSTAGWHVLPTARNEYSFEESDEERSQNLWHWGQTLLREQPTMIQTEHRFTIADLGNLTDQDEEKRRDRDLTVMVTAQIPFLAEALTAITPQGFLRVWDGTGQVPSDPLPIPTLEAKETQRTGDPPAAALTRIASIVQQLKTDSAHVGDAAMKAMETPESLCGKVANAVIWETAHWELVTKHVPVGSFIRLRNVDVLPWKEQPFRCKYFAASIYGTYLGI